METPMGEAPEFTLLDQAGRPWDLAGHLDAAAVLVFYRGDW
jgi:peroxiredoxin